MTRKKQRYELPEEVLAVLESSPNLMSCKKFLHANIYSFADHMKNDACKQCISWFELADKELRTIQLLAAWRSETIKIAVAGTSFPRKKRQQRKS